MEFIGVIVGVAVLAGLAIWAFRRRGSDEVHSVAGYQQRLARLEEARRRQLGNVRVVGGTSETEERARQPVIGEDGRIEISSSSVPRRPEDTGQLPARTERRPPPTPYRRPREISMARISRRPRRLAAPIAAAVVVIILVTGLAIAGARSRTPGATTTTTTAHHKAKTGSTSTTTSTTARPTTFTAASSSGNDATYQLPFAAYTVSFTATTGDCYVEVTNAAGQVPFAAVVNAGQSQQLTLSGNSEIDLGAPAYVQVKIDRTPLVYPSSYQAPLNLILDASSSSAPSSTTTTTTSG